MADEFPTSLQATPPTLNGAEPTDQDLISEALALTADLRKDFEQRDGLLQAVEQILFLEDEIQIPENYRQTSAAVHSPLATHAVNTVVAALSVNPPKTHFPQIDIGDEFLENKARREGFFEASWDQQEREADRGLLRPFVHAVVSKGEGILKTTPRRARVWTSYAEQKKKLLSDLKANKSLDDDAKDRLFDAKTEEFKRGLPYPVATTDVPPETFFHIRGEDGFRIAIEDKQLPYYTTLVDYNLALDAKGRVVNAVLDDTALPTWEWSRVMGGRRTIRMVELWTYDTVTYILVDPTEHGDKDGKSGYKLKKFKHGYGDPYLKVLRGPYFQALGTTTSSRIHGRAGLSLLFGYLELFTAYSRLLTMQQNAAHLTAMPSFKRTQPPAFGMPEQPFGTDAGEALATQQRIEPGKIYPFDISPIEMPRAGVDFDKALAHLRSLIDQLVPPVIQGNVSGDTAGYALNQAAHLARLAWDPMVSNIERALSARTGFESWLIQHRIGERVYVEGEALVAYAGKRLRKGDRGWLAVGPQDLDGKHRYNVELEPEKPHNRILDVRMHRDMLELGLESWRQACEAMGNNPVQVERERLLEAMKREPQVLEALKQRVFQRLGTLDQQALAQSGVQTPGAPPVNGQAQPPDPQQQMAQMLAAAQQQPQGQPPQQPTTVDMRNGQGMAGPTPPRANVGGQAGTPVVPSAPGRHVDLPGGG